MVEGKTVRFFVSPFILRTLYRQALPVDSFGLAV